MAFLQIQLAGGNSFVLETVDGPVTQSAGIALGGGFLGGGSKDKGAGVQPNSASTAVPPSHNAGTTFVSPIGPVAVGGATGVVLAQISSPS